MVAMPLYRVKNNKPFTTRTTRPTFSPKSIRHSHQTSTQGGCGSCLVTASYKEETLNQLGEGRFYKRVDSDPTNNLQEEIKSYNVEQAISTCEIPPSAKDLSVNEPRTSKEKQIICQF